MKNVNRLSKDPYEKLDEYYQTILRSRDTGYQAEIHRFEGLIAQSLKWRIGSFFVDNLIRMVNFFSSPARYIKSRNYRLSWHGEQVGSAPRFQVSYELFPETNHLLKPLPPVPEDRRARKSEGDMSDSDSTKNFPVPVVILDSPSELLFTPENEVYKITPDRVVERIDQIQPSMFFCESALRGNGGAWQYKLTSGDGQVPSDLADLIQQIREKGVPSFFWMTCHREEEKLFREAAFLFDKVLLAREPGDEDYGVFGKEQTGYLPFAANPMMHHPVKNKPVNDRIIMILNHNSGSGVEQDQELQDFIRPALDKGIDIFDRYYGEMSLTRENKAAFGGNISGYCPASKMAENYREYSVMLNATCHRGVEEYIPRRIYEALACGLPVISQPDVALEKAFGQIILFAKNGDEVTEHMENLRTGSLFRKGIITRGIREIMSNHLYGNRYNKLMSMAGLPVPVEKEPAICIMVIVHKNDRLEPLAEMVFSQTYQPSMVTLFTEEELNQDEVGKLTVLFKGLRIKHFFIYQNLINQVVIDSTKCDYYAFWDSGCYYGSEYLNDYRLSLRYSQTGAIGKKDYFVLGEGQMTEQNQGMDYQMVSEVPYYTLMVSADELAGINFHTVLKPGSLFHSFNEQILSSDAMNFGVLDSGQNPATHALIRKLDV